MGLLITTEDFMEYIKLAAHKIAEEKEYVTKLDAATGDGDHWVNMNSGLKAVVNAEEKLKAMPIDEALEVIGMIMMNKIGGSSGILYGGAYLAAGMKLNGCAALDEKGLYLFLFTMAEDMMQRGNARPGFKTMIDALYPAVEAYRDALEQEDDLKTLFFSVKNAARIGAESTRDMEAVKGRACYMAKKGVGHLDPGAVTMYFQIEVLCDYFGARAD